MPAPVSATATGVATNDEDRLSQFTGGLHIPGYEAPFTDAALDMHLDCGADGPDLERSDEC